MLTHYFSLAPMNFPARNKPTAWDVPLPYSVLPAVLIAPHFIRFSNISPRRLGLTFFLEKESKQRIQAL
jgi:hypothetical protein